MSVFYPPLPVDIDEPITAIVEITNFPALQPVSGTIAVSNFPALQPISGTVAINNFPALQPVSGTVAVSNFPAIQPISAPAPIDTEVFNDADTLANKAFVCTTFDLASGAAGENPQVLIRNPAGSGKKMKIYKVAMATNVSANNNSFRFYLNPTVTGNGTLLVPVALNVDAGAPASVMLLTKVPTVSANGTLLMNYTVGPVSTLLMPLEKEIVVAEGKSILINVRPNTTGVTFTVNVFWVEE